MKAMKTESAAGTASLEKALDLLDAIGAAPQGLTQLELAQRLDLPRTTMYRLLSTLVARGLARRDPQRRVFSLGFRCVEWARTAYAVPDLNAAAAPELRALRDLTGETTYLACLDGLEVLSLERVDGAHSQRSAAAPGQRKPLHCTSQGKAILSALPEEQREALVKSLTLAPLTPNTITTRRQLLAELEASAQRGYAVDDEEIALGVRCVGAPVVDAAGRVRGAISVAGPAYRLSRARLDLLGPEVAEAARRVGAQLPVSQPTAIGESNAVVLSSEWAFHGAHPCWEPQAQRLYWADALAPALRVWDGQTERVLAWPDAPVRGLQAHRKGLLAAFDAGYRWFDADGRASALQPWTEEPGWAAAGATSAPQCLCQDALGELWVCLAAQGRSQIGRWLPGEDLSVHWQLPERVSAMAVGTAGQLYAACADTGEVLVLRHDQANVQRLTTVPQGSGRMQGLACDAQGGVWTALQDGWSVVRIAPDGQIDRVVPLSVPSPSDLCLGPAGEGRAGQSLFVTSARQDLSLDALQAAPLSGHLFALPLQAGLLNEIGR
jgi:IclR family transcriptional regulator, acetate operon repressor